MKYSLTYMLMLLSCMCSSIAFAQKGADEKVVPTFVYHRFGDDRFPSTNISNTNFELHLKHLKDQGYESLTFSQSIDYLKSRQKRRKVVCITIDDGYKSFLQNGLPLLQQYGFTATLFINTETVGYAQYLDWEELKTVMNAGIEIGNHSDSHAYFLNDIKDSARTVFGADLIKSQSLIESNLGITPTVFAYPYGEFDEQMKAVISGMGFKGAAAQSSGVNNPRADFYEIARFPMSDRFGKVASFREKLEMLPIVMDQIQVINTGYSGNIDNPRVIFKFNQENLLIEQVQCFVQGKPCAKSLRILRDGDVQLSVKSKEVLTGRRSLYTVTAPDTNGKWHWYSFTYVNPGVTN